MKPTYHHYSEGSLTRIVTVSFLFAATCLTALAQTDDLFVSFHDTDTISLYNAITGALVNSAFASVQSPTGLVVGPDNNLYVGSDNLSGAEGAGIVTFGINGVTSGPAQDYVTHIDDNNLNNPRGLAFIGSTLYVADLTSGNVMIYPTPHTAGTTLASANINGASGLSASGGNLYIADINEGNVLRYDGATVTQVNAVGNTFISAQDVAVGHDGNLYVLNPSQGIYKLSLSDGSATKIVDYSTSFFEATDIVVGPDGNLYVSGQDGDAEGGVFEYGTDGSGGGIFADTGFETMPDGLTFSVPEPTTLSIAALGMALFATLKLRPRRAKPV